MLSIVGVGQVEKWDAIISGGNFSWGEATKDGTRMPPDVETSRRIIALATELQPRRERFGQILHVSSWYRPPDVNAAVGGVSDSRHIFGDGVDLSNPNYSGYQLEKFFSDWPGGVGVYHSHLHVDLGPKRSW